MDIEKLIEEEGREMALAFVLRCYAEHEREQVRLTGDVDWLDKNEPYSNEVTQKLEASVQAQRQLEYDLLKVIR